MHWYLTGDTVQRDAEGHYFFVGRDDDIITSAGYRIGPFDVESSIIEHPPVAEVAVVGKPDPERTQIVKAFVVLRSGITPSDALKIEPASSCTPIRAKSSPSMNCRRHQVAKCSGFCSDGDRTRPGASVLEDRRSETSWATFRDMGAWRPIQNSRIPAPWQLDRHHQLGLAYYFEQIVR